jgi:hypothetical protein
VNAAQLDYAIGRVAQLEGEVRKAKALLHRVLSVGNGGVVNAHGYQAEGITGQVYDFLGIEPEAFIETGEDNHDL